MRRKGKVVDVSESLEAGRGRYTCVYERDESGAWIVHVEEVPGCHTWGETLRQARGNLRDALSLWVDDAETAELDERINLPDGIAAAVKQSKAARARLGHDQQEASRHTEEAARALVNELGIGLRDAGDLLDLSFQRVQQIIHPRERHGSSGRRSSSRRTAASSGNLVAKQSSAVNGRDTRRSDPSSRNTYNQEQPIRRIAVVDDNVVIQEGLRHLLPDRIRIEITASSIEDFLAEGRVDVDVVVLESQMPATSSIEGQHKLALQGVQAIRVLTEERDHQVLLYTNEMRTRLLAVLVAAGALGLVHKSEPLHRLVEAIDAIAEGSTALTSNVAMAILDVLGQRDAPALSPQEAEVFKLYAAGNSLGQIAKSLHRTPKAVDASLRRVTTRFGEYLDAHNDAQIWRELGINEEASTPD
jgi:DNA-binding NarL/FixJ family response regulator/predicted RNase H-like HicB family nuclease